jgi:hypothetical protein
MGQGKGKGSRRYGKFMYILRVYWGTFIKISFVVHEGGVSRGNGKRHADQALGRRNTSNE